MGVKNFKLPDPGEGLVEAEIVSWKVKPGDTVKTNDIVVEVETAKSLVELPVPWDGDVVELLVPEGTTVEVGQPILAVEVEGAEDDAPVSGGAAEAAAGAGAAGSAGGDAAAEEGERVANLVGYGPSTGSTRRRRRKGGAGAPGQAAEGAQAAMGQVGGPAAGHAPAEAVAETDTPEAAAPEPAAASAAPDPTAPAAPAAQPSEGAPSAPVPGDGGRPLAKPPVRKFAKDNGVDLALVTPTGGDGIITRADIEQFLATGGAAEAAGAEVATGAAAAAAQAPAYPAVPGERETRIPIKGVRKVTAQAMVGSAFTAPHVTEFVTVDVTRTMKLVQRLREDREFAGVRVSPLLVVAKALILAVRRHPGVNATWDEAGGVIVQKNYVNLGIAAATPRGLIVPNIKDADRMSLRQLADAIAELTQTAREGRTTPAAQAGGTITITNVGVFGVDNGTPIINPGESAILCFGAVRRMPWVVTGKDGSERIKPRWVTQLSLAFDHRLVDGDLGSRTLADVAAVLEDPAKALVWG